MKTKNISKKKHGDETPSVERKSELVCLFGWFLNVLVTWIYHGRVPILRPATHETEQGDHDFCLSRSHYTDTDPTRRERVDRAGIEPMTASPEVARSTD